MDNLCENKNGKTHHHTPPPINFGLVVQFKSLIYKGFEVAVTIPILDCQSSTLANRATAPFQYNLKA